MSNLSERLLAERLLAGVQNMLTKRRWNSTIPPTSPYPQSKLIELESKIGNVYMTQDDEEKVLLFIPSIVDGVLEKVKNEQTHYLYFLMEHHDCSHAIVPYSSLAPQASEVLKSHSFYTVELFPYKSLLFDPTVHKLVPAHTLLSEQEAKFELGNIKISELPFISDDDVIVRFFSWKKGSVIRIRRDEGVVYRVVS